MVNTKKDPQTRTEAQSLRIKGTEDRKHGKTD